MNLINVWFEFSWYILFVVSVCHSLLTEKKWSTINFFLPLFVLCLVLEEISIIIFRGYQYFNYKIYLLDVPLSIILGWCTIVYVSFSLAKQLLILKKKSLYTLNYGIIKLTLISTFIALSADLFLEPIANTLDLWTWSKLGIYYGTSIGNFVGWFFVISIFIGVYTLLTEKVKNEVQKILAIFCSLPFQIIILIMVGILWKSIINL